MPDGSNSGRHLPSEIELTRRQALAGLGTAGVLGAGGLSTALDGSPPEDDVRSELWMAQRRRKFARPSPIAIPAEDLPNREETLRKVLWDTPERSHDQLSSLEYLGASWEPYGNPQPGDGAEGAWQHSFVLCSFGMTQEIPYDQRSDYRNDGFFPSFPVEHQADWSFGTIPTLRVQAARNQGAMAVSPVRDRNTFGFFYPPDSESAGYPEFTDDVAANANRYLADFGLASAIVASNQEFGEDAAAIGSVAKTLISLHPLAGAAIGIAEGIADIFSGVAELLDQPQQVDPDGLRFYEGFEQSYPNEDFAAPYCGGFVLFHVYVAPSESCEVDVTADLSHELQTPPYVPGVDASSTWTIGFDATPRPEDATLSAADRHNAEVVDYEESASINNPDAGGQAELPEPRSPYQLSEYDSEKRPAPSIVPAESNPESAEGVADGTTLRFHAYDTAVVDSHVDSYEWSVYYTEPAEGGAKQYVDRVVAEEYAGGSGPEFQFTVDSPDDAGYTNVHRVSLTVTDEEGRSASKHYDVVQGDLAEPEFTIEMSGDPYQWADLTFTAALSSTPSSVAAYRWEVTQVPYDLPSTATPWTETGEEFQFTPTEPGAYAFELTVVDETGASATEERTVQVREVDPSVSILAPRGDRIKAGEDETFSVAVEGLPQVPRESITWEFPDGTETGYRVDRTFSRERVGDTVSVTVTVDSEHAEALGATREFEVFLDDDLEVELHAPDAIPAGVEKQVRLEVLGGAETDLNYSFTGTDSVNSSQRTSNTLPVTVDEFGPHEVEGTALETGDNRESASDSATIQVEPFVVTIEGDDSPKEGESVTYDAVVEGDAGDATFEWDAFGETDAGTSTTGTFEEPGDRTVSVAATTSDGETVSASLDVDVQADSDMSVTLDVPDRFPIEETQTVRAEVSGAEADLSYSFGGTDSVNSGQYDSPTRPLTLQTPGEHEVSVTATEMGDNRESASTSTTVTAYDPDQDMTVSLSAPDSISVGQTKQVEASVSGAEADLNYGFGGTDQVDSSQRTSNTRPVTAKSTGTHEVSVTATEVGDNNETASDSTTIEFVEPQVTIGGDDTPKEGETVTYSASVAGDPPSDAVGFEWSAFGRTEAGDSISESFDGPGEHDVELTATVHGVTVTETLTISVQSDSDMAVTLNAPDRVPIGQTETVSAEVTGAEADLNYSFSGTDPVDSGQRTSNTRPATFESPGEYEVSVTATEVGDNNETASDSTTITAYDPDQDMTVSLSAPDQMHVGQTKQVEASVSGAEADLNYGFSGTDQVNSGQRTSNTRPVTAKSTGTHEVSVTASETGDNHETASASTTIEFLPPAVSISGDSTPKSGTSETYTASVAGSPPSDRVSFEWSAFGRTESGDSISESFSSGGSHAVEVTATVYGVTATETLDVDVQADDDMTASLTGPDRLAVGETGQVEASASGYEGTLNYSFSGADSVNSGQRDSPTRPVTVESTGSHTVEVEAFEIDDNGESATASHTIDVYDPDDDMSVSLSGPDRLEVGETGTVRADVSGAEATVNYSFSNVDPVNSGARDDPYRDVSYDSPGSETVEVTASEIGDNHESASASTTIDVDAPSISVSLSADDTSVTTGETVNLSADVDDGTGGVDYDWDGASGSGSSISESWSSAGRYTVSVTADDGYGSDSDSVTIDVTAPEPDPSVSIDGPTTPSACSGSWNASASTSNADSPVSYDWYLDGSSVGSGSSVSFTVNDSASHTLRVEIEDADGDTASASASFSSCAGMY